MPSDPQTTAAPGRLVVNADDWGRDRRTTDLILGCVRRGAVSAASGMVLMADSGRAADLARECGLDVGLHLNFTTPFTAPGCPESIRSAQQRLMRCLRAHRFAPVLFHPRLQPVFAAVISAQIDEYRRIYGRDPERLDGHHHMHLCSNVVAGNLLPAGTRVRRQFTFRRGEKAALNRAWRGLVDARLGRRHSLADFLFSLRPLAASRLQQIFTLARCHVVEIECHPVEADEYRFLAGGELLRYAGSVGLLPAPFPPPDAVRWNVADGTLTRGRAVVRGRV